MSLTCQQNRAYRRALAWGWITPADGFTKRTLDSLVRRGLLRVRSVQPLEYTVYEY